MDLQFEHFYGIPRLDILRDAKLRRFQVRLPKMVKSSRMHVSQQKCEMEVVAETESKISAEGVIKPTSKRLTASALPEELLRQVSRGNFKAVLECEDHSFEDLVVVLLDSMEDLNVGMMFFKWAESQEGYQHKTIAYNRYMDLLLKHRRFEELQAVYDDMRSCEPDRYSMAILLRSYLKQNKLEKAQRYAAGLLTRRVCDVAVMNILIDGLCKANLVDEAQRFFNEMLGMGYRPDRITYNSLLNGYCNSDRMEDAKRIYNEMMKKKRCPPNDVTIKSLIHGYCKAGRVNEALQLMKEESKFVADVRAYNSLISGYCKSDRISEAEGIVEKMISEGFVPDIVTYNSLLGGLCKMGKLSEANKLLDTVLKKGLIPDEVTYSTLINGLCKEEKIQEAVQLFEKIISSGIKPDTIIYNTLIDGLCKSKMLDEAESLIQRMIINGCRPDMYTYNSLLNGMCKYRGMDVALEFCDQIRRQKYRFEVSTYNILLDGLLKVNRVHKAFEVFSQMSKEGIFPTTATYTIFISGLCKVGKMDEAQKMLVRMREKGCEPDVISYNTVLNGLCKKDIDVAEEFLAGMATHGCEPNAVSYNTLLYGLCVRTQWERALKLVKEMIERGMQPNVASYNILRRSKPQDLKAVMDGRASIVADDLIRRFCEKENIPSVEKFFEGDRKKNLESYATLISGVCKLRRMDDARNLLRALEEYSVPNIRTYNKVLKGLVNEGKVEEAQEVFVSMVEKGCVPTEFTYTAIITGFAKEGDVDKALAVLEVMFAAGFSARDDVYDTLAEAICKREDDVELCERLMGLINGRDYETLVQVFCKHGSLKIGSMVVEKMQEKDMKCGKVVYKSLMEVLCSKGKVMDALSLCKKLVEVGDDEKKFYYRCLLNWLCTVDPEMYGGDDVKIVMEELTKEMYVPDVVSYVKMVNISLKEGNIRRAKMLLKFLKEKKCAVGLKSYDAVIRALCYAEGKVEEAMELYEEMKSDGISGDVLLMKVLLETCVANGREEYSVKLREDMERRNEEDEVEYDKDDDPTIEKPSMFQAAI